MMRTIGEVVGMLEAMRTSKCAALLAQAKSVEGKRNNAKGTTAIGIDDISVLSATVEEAKEHSMGEGVRVYTCSYRAMEAVTQRIRHDEAEAEELPIITIPAITYNRYCLDRPKGLGRRTDLVTFVVGKYEGEDYLLDWYPGPYLEDTAPGKPLPNSAVYLYKLG